MCVSGVRDRARKLTGDRLRAQLYDRIERFRRGHIFVIGVKRGWICFYQCVDLGTHTAVERVECSVFHIIDELREIFPVRRVVRRVGEERVEEIRRVKGIRDRIVHHRGRVSAAHTAEREIIVPRDEVQPAVRFIQVVIVRHGARQAVLVYGKDMRRHVPHEIVGVHVCVQRFPCGDFPERLDHTRVIFVIRRCHFAFPDRAVAVGIVIRITQIRAVSAHGKAASTGGIEIERTGCAIIKKAAVLWESAACVRIRGTICILSWCASSHWSAHAGEIPVSVVFLLRHCPVIV